MTKEKAIKELKEVADEQFSADRAEAIYMAIGALKQQKIGKWKLVIDIHNLTDWKCSLCGGTGRADYIYCPVCGAKMEEE